MVSGKAVHERRYEVNNLAQAFVLIEKILDANDKQGLTQLSRSICFSKNKTFRLLTTLEYYGIVEKDSQSNYGIGLTALAAARKVLDKSSSLDKVRPYLKAVSEAINEAVYFAYYGREEAVLVDFVDCRHPVKAASFVGSSFILSGCGNSDRKVRRVVGIGDIIVDAGGLDPEITTVSAPMVKADGAALGAMVVLAPSFRMPLERIKTEIVPVLREVAHRHSLTMPDKGKKPSPPLALPVERDSGKRPALLA